MRLSELILRKMQSLLMSHSGTRKPRWTHEALSSKRGCWIKPQQYTCDCLDQTLSSGGIKSRSLSSVRSVKTWATHLSHQNSLSIEIASLKNFFYPSLFQLQEFEAFSQPGANRHIQLHISIPSTLAAWLILNWDILEEIHGTNWLAPTLKMCLGEFTIKEWTNLVHRRLIQCCDLKLNPSLANSCDNHCNTGFFYLA